jgi:membrane protein DedA with SNARE-associated domain
MTESLLALLPVWGAAVVGLVTFLSCLALPIPASLVMLTSGALAASSDLDLALAVMAALGGAIAGDQLGYAAGRRWGGGVLDRAGGSPSRAAIVAQARASLDRSGTQAVFLSRWLFSPLGPWINLAAGAAGMPWLRFTPPAILGEAVWVGLYIGLGFGFADSIGRLADIGGAATGLLAAMAVTIAAGLGLRTALRHRPASAQTG